MSKIKSKVFSHIRQIKETEVFPDGKWFAIGDDYELKKKQILEKGEYSVSQIRKSLGYPIKNFRQLVVKISELGFENHSYNLLFRGQNEDHLDKKGQSKLYPRIYRPQNNDGRLSKRLLDQRFNILKQHLDTLKQERKIIRFHRGLSKFEEYQISILQHYELCDTPFLDLTQSARVAATFALHKAKTGYLFVLGMPHTYGSISLFVDQGLRLVKLQNICPPEALRPHYQEGFLVGRLPYTIKKNMNDNFAHHLIGKYFLNNSDGKFWDKEFQAIPYDALIPPKDKFEDKLRKLIFKKDA